MAFLCPSQLTVKRKALQGKAPLPDTYHPNGKPGRATGEYKSALKSPNSSIDSPHKSEQRTVRINEGSLKRDSLERKIKSSTLDRPANVKVRIRHDFGSADPEELEVRKGQIVNILYQQHDWVYVADTSGNEGFVPFTYCSTRNASIDSKSSTSGYDESVEGSDELERVAQQRKIDKALKHHRTNKQGHKTPNKTPVTYFPKRPYGPKLTVLYNYKARYENDVSVERGEFVMLLNDQDPDWLWVVAEDGEEGFVPRTFVISHACEGCRDKLSKGLQNLSSNCIDKPRHLFDNNPCNSADKSAKTHISSPWSNGSVSRGVRKGNLSEHDSMATPNMASTPGNVEHVAMATINTKHREKHRHKTKSSSENLNDITRSGSDKSSDKGRQSRAATPHGSRTNLHASKTDLVSKTTSHETSLGNETKEEPTPSSSGSTPFSSYLTPFIQEMTSFCNDHTQDHHNDLYSSDMTTPTSSSSIELNRKSADSSLTDATSSGSSDKKLELKGSKLISLYEYEGTAFDDLTVHAGEYVYANLKDQIVPKWIWAYSPYRRRSGFIPEAYLKEPVVTDI